MTNEETIKTWRWRIVKAGFKISEFAATIGVQPARMTGYMSGKVRPRSDIFDKIEGKLKEHDV